METPQRILVTGGAGLIGSHLCRRLLGRGHDVICMDNFFTSRKSNIADLLDAENFELIRDDVIQPVWLEVDQTYNLACPASPVHYQRNPVQTLQTSIAGAMNLLANAERTGSRILQASTSEVYGDPDVSPQPESYRGRVNPIGPRACYDEGKRCAETLFFDTHRTRGVDIRIARIFNTYGPGMSPWDGRVISNFILQALRNQPITLYGDGKQTRSFCYVDDLVEGLIRLMDNDAGLTGPMNLGNPEEITIAELAGLIVELTGSDSPLAHEPLPADDPAQRKPDITLARTELNWQPTVGLREGLARTIEYFRHAADGCPTTRDQ